MCSFPWINFQVGVPTDDQQKRSELLLANASETGDAVIVAPWPYMARTMWGDS